MISQRALTVFAGWMTYIPALIVLYVVQAHHPALLTGIALLWLTLEAHAISQLNFYRSEAALDVRKDEADHHKYFKVGDRARKIGRVLRTLSVVAPLVMWAA